MAAGQKWEIAGFVTIAAALHVAAAAIVMPERIAMGAAFTAPPAPVAAGSGRMSELVEQWENPPETAEEPEMTEPEEMAEPEIEQPTPDRAPERAPETPQVPAAPELSAAKPNLPEPPEPQPEPVKPELPELQRFEPPEIKSELALDTSERPGQKPPKPEPEPEPEPEVAREAEPAPQRQAAQPEPASQGGGAGGDSSSRSAGGGSSGVSEQQRASLMSQWSSQLSACIYSGASRASIRGGGRLTVNVTIAPNGGIQGVSLAASSGDSRVDRAVMQAISRVGRCPAAPAALNITSSRTAPMTVSVR